MLHTPTAQVAAADSDDAVAAQAAAVAASSVIEQWQRAGSDGMLEQPSRPEYAAKLLWARAASSRLAAAVTAPAATCRCQEAAKREKCC